MNLTPTYIVKELDRYIIGQDTAKKMVAIALRNRYRRSMLPEEVRNEITPKNIIMKGPTGVGKTEIARRLAKLVKAPFVKVEATKFTEVGYVGRDVESMIRDLVEVAVRLVKEEKIAEIEPKAKATAESKIINTFFAARKKREEKNAGENEVPTDEEIREQLAHEFRTGELDKYNLEMEMPISHKTLQLGPLGGNETNLGDFMNTFLPKQTKKRKVTVRQAYNFFLDEELNKMLDNDAINAEGLKRAEQSGIIFIDEIDKIASKGNISGPDVSREGVQRDILPIVEGCTVSTKYGNLVTDFILFIAAGAFHIAKVNDLIPELQGRFPVHVELNSLTEEDFFRILKEPDNAIIMQYVALLKVDNIQLQFTDEAVREIAKAAFIENENNEDIGARRLHTVLENLLQEISFQTGGESVELKLIDRDYVNKHMSKSLSLKNLKKYVL